MSMANVVKSAFLILKIYVVFTVLFYRNKFEYVFGLAAVGLDTVSFALPVVLTCRAIVLNGKLAILVLGQIVSILVDDKYKGYIVNRDSQGSYYVNKLTEDDISKNGIVYLKGTLSNKLIIFELGEGIYSIEGQYQIVPDGTVYMTGGKELFICSNGSVHHVNGNSIEKYTVADDGTVNIETYLTSADLSQYMTITDAQQIISDLVSQNVENEVIKALGKSIAQQSDIENILNK